MHLHPTDDGGGAAADTGSAMHKAAAEFHRGKGEADAIAAMSEGIGDYPLADLADAAKLFLHYVNDPRNRTAKVILVEHPIAFSIAPAPEDKTGAQIEVIGRVDQVRQHEDGRKRVWDIKTSKKDPNEILNSTFYQMAAYCVGAATHLGERVDPGGIIMPRRYPNNAHFSYPWTFDDLEQIMLAVRHAVASVRNGHVWHVPNKDCNWCVLRSPDLCLPKLKEHRRTSLPLLPTCVTCKTTLDLRVKLVSGVELHICESCEEQIAT